MGQAAISCTDRKLLGSLPELRLTWVSGLDEGVYTAERPSS
jgi:hypothetical protein